MRYVNEQTHGNNGPDPLIVRKIALVAYQEPIRELRVSFLWESLAEEMISDSPFHSDLDPLTAPMSMLEIKPEEQLKSSLWNYLTSLRHFRDRHENERTSMLSRIDSVQQSEDDVRHVFDRLSAQAPINLSLPTFRSYLPRMPDPTAESLVQLIFRPERADADFGDVFGLEVKSLGSCMFDNLTWRIAHLVAFLVLWLKDENSLCLIWRMIIHRLRQNWQCNQPLVG